MTSGRRAAESLEAQAKVPIRENGEALVDFVGLSPRLRFAERHPVFDFERVHRVRRRVAEMLVAAAESLPAGLNLTVVEGWRSPAVQRQMYEATEREQRAQHPDWPAARLRRQVDRYSARPDHPVPPPHCTGGAVDVDLTTDDGESLDMISPYAMADRRHNPTRAPGLTPTARRHRKLLIATMTAAGFSNYPAEWWHWEYGTPGWALRTGQPAAVYHLVVPPGR